MRSLQEPAPFVARLQAYMCRQYLQTLEAVAPDLLFTQWSPDAGNRLSTCRLQSVKSKGCLHGRGHLGCCALSCSLLCCCPFCSCCSFSCKLICSRDLGACLLSCHLALFRLLGSFSSLFSVAQCCVALSFVSSCLVCCQMLLLLLRADVHFASGPGSLFSPPLSPELSNTLQSSCAFSLIIRLLKALAGSRYTSWLLCF